MDECSDREMDGGKLCEKLSPTRFKVSYNNSTFWSSHWKKTEEEQQALPTGTTATIVACHTVITENSVGIRLPEKDNKLMNLPEIPGIKTSNIGQFDHHSILVL